MVPYEAWIRLQVTSPGSSRKSVVITDAKLPKEFVEIVSEGGKAEVTFSALGSIRLKRSRRGKA